MRRVTPGRDFGRLLFLGAGMVLPISGWAQSSAEAPLRCVITGRVASGGVPLPGVAVIARSTDGREGGAAASGLDGAYRLIVLGPGTYSLSANLAGFADATQEVTLPAGNCGASADFAVVLRSRAPRVAGASKPEPEAPSATGVPATPAPTPPAGPVRTRPGAGAGSDPTLSPRGRGNAAGQPGRRFQNLDVRPEGTGTDAGPDATAESLDPAAQSLLPPGFAADAPMESIAAAAGNQVETVDTLLFRDRLQMLEDAGGDIEAMARRMAEGGFGGAPGGFGAGGGPGGGGFGGGRGGAGGFGGGGPGGGGRNNRLQGSVNYNLSGSPLDARPFALNGKAAEKAEYFQHRYGATLGGPVKIPGLYDGSTRTSFALTYSGTHTRNPFDAYSTVPTAAEREGDFSASGRPFVDPLTNQPFPGGIIPANRIDPASRALLSFLPLPNQPGVSQNFRNVTTSTNRSNEFSLRLNHMFGSPPAPNARATNPQGRPGQPGATRRTPGPRGPGGAPAVRRRPTLTATITYRNSSRSDTSAFPTLGGSTRGSALDLPVSFSFSTGQVFHQLRFGFNRNRSEGTNLYAYSRDVTGIAGINGVSRDPFNWGVPSLSFSTVTDVRDRNPSYRQDQRLSLGETASRTWKKHTFRVGAEVRLQKLDSQTDQNARGNYVFTGYYTAAMANGAPLPGTGLDFADFLLGRPQQASVQFGPGRVRYSSQTVSFFLQDDWRIRNNLTLNLGLRYEFVSPFEEENNHLVNLDVTPGFTAAAPVLAGETGAFSGRFPDGLIQGDTNNVAPRVGAAWKAKPNLTVRAGFGINYNLGAYPAIAQKLAGQPPFAVSDTRISSRLAPLTLADAFGGVGQGLVTTNTYGIDRNYQVPTVALWNLDVQRDLKNGLIVAAGYSGSRGYNLDLVRAPNRSATGLRIPGVAPFLWQSSEATSIMHSGTLRVRKRMSRGVSGGFTYTLAKSLDNAAAIGGGATVVAQDDTDLEAERGRSSFDRKHRFTGDFLVELPFGQGRKWLREGVWSNVLGGWVWTGTITAESGAPFTARVVGDIADVARGVNGTLRASLTGAPVTLTEPSIQRWFNTAAFSVPTAGTFGNAGRNTITGPGTFLVNMSLIKNFSLGRPRVLSVRIQATNVFNTPQLTGIDTVVNSPTFGQVTRVGSMRTVQIQTRFRF